MSLPTHGAITGQPIGSLIFSLAAAAYDGDLAFEQDGRRAVLWFQSGQVVDADSTYPEDQVLRVMVAANLLTTAQVGQALQRLAASPDRSPVAVVAELGFIGPDMVPRVELHALARRALRPFAMASGRYGFDAKSLPRPPASSIDSRWLVYRGVREHFDDARLSRELGALAGMAFKLLPGALETLDAYGFAEQERLVATYVSKGYWELADLLDATVSVPRAVTLATIYALCTTGGLELAPAESVPRLKRRAQGQTERLPDRVVAAVAAQAPHAPVAAQAPVAPPPAPPPPEEPSSSPPTPDGMVPGYAPTQVAPPDLPVDVARVAGYDATGFSPVEGVEVRQVEGFAPTQEDSGGYVRRDPVPPPSYDRVRTPNQDLAGRHDEFDLENSAPAPTTAPAPAPAMQAAQTAPAPLPEPAPVHTRMPTPAPVAAEDALDAPTDELFQTRPPTSNFTGPGSGAFAAPGTGSFGAPASSSFAAPPAGSAPQTSGGGRYIQGRNPTHIGQNPLGADPSHPRAATPTPLPARPAPGTGVSRSPMAPSPPSGSSPPSSSGPTATAPPGLRDQIQRKFNTVEKGADHFAVLEVGRDATSAQIKTAYFSLAKLYHPDRVAILRLEELRPQIDRIFAALSQAFSATGDDAKRAEYLKVLSQGGHAAIRAREDKDAERAAQIISAEEQFQIGEMAMRRQQWQQARDAFQRAAIMNSDEAEHHAYLGWAIFMGATDKNSVLNEVKKHLAKALDLNTRCAAAHFFVGKMYLAVNDEVRALNAFQHVLDEQPEHMDALREIRLLNMRKGNPKKGGGLFDRLRGK